MTILRGLVVIGALTLAASPVRAQDTRDVREPVIPPACVSLSARLQVVGDSTVAEADERKLDTERIQQALDACGAGKSVRLVADGARRAFLSGALELRAGVALVVEKGAVFFAARDPRLFDADTLRRCGTVDRRGGGCYPLIRGRGVAGAGVMGDGIIDGRGWAKLLGRDTTWWQLAEIARAGGSQNNPRLLHLVRANDFTLYRITLRNAGQFHVMYSDGNGFTAWGVKVWAPEDSRNTDGIDPQNSTNVTITRSFIHAGDDNVAIKAAAGPSKNITISRNHFYSGHGMSIGSETNGGVSAVRVTDLSIEGADNGLRIKSNETRGGPVSDVVYEDVCIRDTKNPIFMDTHYSFLNQARGLIPVFRDITLRNVRIAGKGKVTLDGYDATRRLGMRWDGVLFEDAPKVQVKASHAEIALGPGPANLPIAGEDVTVTGTAGVAGAPGKAAPAAASCSEKFVPFPGSPR